MGTEIERKFLVNDESWREQIWYSILIRQGYLVNDDEKSVRVRVTGNQGFITVKDAFKIKRREYEYQIPAEAALQSNLHYVETES